MCLSKAPEQDMQGYNSIRKNFSDYAFWQPRLRTNKKGIASFEAIFPDDITQWETFYLAMKEGKQSGQTSGGIKSYRPLMAQLSLPRFLVQGDTAFAIGKVLNYTSDSLSVNIRFEVNGQAKAAWLRKVGYSLTDSLMLTATDSLTLKYTLEKTDGYFDGEQRKLPVLPAGISETHGDFYTLSRDTTLRISLDSAMGEVSIYAMASALEVVENQWRRLANYRYDCNEQIASRLKAMLAGKVIALSRKEPFRYDKDINKHIQILTHNQNHRGLWGWWKESEERYWISLHALEALLHAQHLGYNTNIGRDKLIEQLMQLLDSQEPHDQVRVIRMLALLDFGVAPLYIQQLEKKEGNTLEMQLNLTELRQLYKMP
jgi:uncharacterized protein YfaS (alpha-2-macroglobulin family)